MSLSGKRIKLRAAELSDANSIYAWENDPSHWLVSNQSAPMSMRQIKQFIENDNDVFANRQLRLMMVDESDSRIGCVDFFDFDPKNHRIGIGILVDPRFRGEQYGKEALDLALNYCFHMLEVNCVYADVLSTNIGSIKLFESLGFIRTGTRKQWLWNGAGYSDLHLYQIFKS